MVSEVRYKDVIFEKLVSQLLKDYLAKIDQGENTTDPISGPFNKSFTGFGYKATIKIYNIKVIQELFWKKNCKNSAYRIDMMTKKLIFLSSEFLKNSCKRKKGFPDLLLPKSG